LSQWARPRVAIVAGISLLAILPLFALASVFFYVLRADGEALDFGQYHTAARRVLEGASPNWDPPPAPAYPYPPLTALLVVPLSPLPVAIAEVIAMLGLAAAVVGTLLVLGVRDWRCYGLAFLWPPVLAGVQTGNVTILLGLAAALAWRYRDRPLPAGFSIGLTLAAKHVLWPMVLWLGATRRFLTAAISCAIGAAVLFASWAVIGFAGLSAYPDIARGAMTRNDADTYTFYATALDLGMTQPLARIIWLGIAVALLGGVAVLGRRGDDRGAFALAIAAAIACSPIVWLHYFELLLVVVAIAQPRLALVWFLPLAMYLSAGQGNGTTFEAAFTLAAAAATVAATFFPARPGARSVPTMLSAAARS